MKGNSEKRRRGNGFIVAVMAGVISSFLTLTFVPYSQEMTAEMEQKLDAISEIIHLNKRLIKGEGR
ncbi:hypothetical protein FZW96_18075 [Bacillus sp. BGMRC 2118]|nr:hypothetical protein FZW96_18075 [Bacillus sp. BGMRC 2118]